MDTHPGVNDHRTMLTSLCYHYADQLTLLQIGLTALTLASHKGHSATVQTLLADPRVDVNLQDMVGDLDVPR